MHADILLKKNSFFSFFLRPKPSNGPHKKRVREKRFHKRTQNGADDAHFKN